MNWPALDWEDRSWQPRIPPSLVSAAVRERHAGPYRAAVVPHIAELTPRLSGEVLALSEDASAEIARFDAELGSEVAPFASVLLRSESASSSMIENLTSGAKAIALAELGSTDKRNATEIVGNVGAMRAALALADRLDAEAILTMHAALMGAVHPGMAGTWRDEQVWIGGTSFGPHAASFVPPHQEHVPSLVDDLVCFARRTDVPLLARAAIAHAQFETIHPFPDGNGRTGRALINAMLRGHGLTKNVTVPVSAGLLTDTTSYFDALTAYRTGDPAAIVVSLAEASFEATANGRQLVRDLHAIRAGWDNAIKARRGAGAWRLADLLLRQPVVDAATVAAELGLAPQNTQRVVAALADSGVLTEFTGFRRNRMWQATEVLTALDDFAARAGRRMR
ncbi:Fic family protein [Modestobacter sp. DSM 44400]|uniref:Fic family protein n=1 Tax=Modestobacter sp. DSM 44400 TaxID=1550230 RepID=UPI001C31A081|nr:Fic family protein [Modestobacter sp. DSM 44400]